MSLTPSRGLRIVALGDSTTAGTPGFRSPVESPPRGRGNEESQFAYWMMRDHPKWLVLNRGVNGERTDEILARFERDVVKEEPSVVIVLAGVNDIFQGFRQESVRANISEMYRRVELIGAVGVGCSVLPYNSMTKEQAAARRELNSWVREECKRRSLSFCDTAAAVSKSGEPDRLASSPDGLHPGVEGYRAMGRALGETIERALSEEGEVSGR